MHIYFMQIKKTDVRRSESGVECQICIQWKLKLQEPAELCYTVYLHGAKHPTNFFHVRILDSHLKCASCKLYLWIYTGYALLS